MKPGTLGPRVRSHFAIAAVVAVLLAFGFADGTARLLPAIGAMLGPSAASEEPSLALDAPELDDAADGVALPAWQVTVAPGRSEAAQPGPQAVVEAAASTTRPQRLVSSYEVRMGDTVQSIAAQFGITPDTIVWANKLASSSVTLVVGQKLTILPQTGVLHQMQLGDTIGDLAAKYGADAAAIAEANDLHDPYTLVDGRQLLIPGGHPPRAVAVTAPAAGATAVVSATTGGVTALAVPTTTARAVTSSRAGTRERNGATLTPPQERFLASAIGPAQDSQQETGVPASVTLAQALLESNWGNSDLSRKANNFFGIKANGRAGTAGLITVPTGEYINGSRVVVQASFRAYKTMVDSFVDHGRYLRDGKIYAEAMRHTGDPKTFARLIHKAGYATDPNYANKLIAFMDKYDLYAFDLR